MYPRSKIIGMGGGAGAFTDWPLAHALVVLAESAAKELGWKRCTGHHGPAPASTGHHRIIFVDHFVDHVEDHFVNHFPEHVFNHVVNYFVDNSFGTKILETMFGTIGGPLFCTRFCGHLLEQIVRPPTNQMQNLLACLRDRPVPFSSSSCMCIHVPIPVLPRELQVTGCERHARSKARSSPPVNKRRRGRTTITYRCALQQERVTDGGARARRHAQTMMSYRSAL